MLSSVNKLLDEIQSIPLRPELRHCLLWPNLRGCFGNTQSSAGLRATFQPFKWTEAQSGHLISCYACCNVYYKHWIILSSWQYEACHNIRIQWLKSFTVIQEKMLLLDVCSLLKQTVSGVTEVYHADRISPPGQGLAALCHCVHGVPEKKRNEWINVSANLLSGLSFGNQERPWNASWN